MSRFLPPSAQDYGVAAPREHDFTHNDESLLSRIGTRMTIPKAQTQGRAPSPVSRAYLFYTALFQQSIDDDAGPDDEPDMLEGLGWKALHTEARRTFRGMLAVFALRNVLNLDISFRMVELLQGDDDDLSTLLLSALQSAPGGEDFWREMKFYTVRVGDGPEEVLAGRSPLTTLYPSARQPERLTGLYWYDVETQTWYDPTSDTLDDNGGFHIQHKTRHRMRQLMKVWLDAVINPGLDAVLQDEFHFGLSTSDAQRFVSELKEWQSDLAAVNVTDTDIEVVEDDLTSDSRSAPLPFLSLALKADPSGLLSTMPIRQGRIVVTKKTLYDKKTRVYGRLRGSHKGFQNAIDDLPRQGHNLGEALGLGPDAIPIPFVYINKYFTPYLTPLTGNDLSDEWSAMTVTISGRDEHYLIPLHPEILEIIPPEELPKRISGKLHQQDGYIRVTLDLGDAPPILKDYDNDKDATGPPQADPVVERDDFDLRLFPNFDLNAFRHVLGGVGMADAQYHARFRLSPTWDFQSVRPFALENGRLVHSKQDMEATLHHLGDTSPGNDGTPSLGRAAFLTFRRTPNGFSVPKRGFCIVALDDTVPDLNPARWKVGVDFGTSNTCIAVQKGNDQPEVLELPVFTTTLFQRPNYDANFDEADTYEGASAVLDFFYQFQNERTLTTEDYFPTQFITQQPRIEEDDTFDIRNGLIYFGNIGLADVSILRLLESFSDALGENEKKVASDFRVEDDIKWEDNDLLKVYMHHLRKQIVLTAARKNATIEEVHFSYPKAFNRYRREKFERHLEQVWHQTDEALPLDLCSESEAVRDAAVDNRNEHVLFDIGGGTTDIIAFHNQQSVFQTSFQLAAGVVNDYVVAAPSFREAFADSIQGSSRAERILGNLRERFIRPAEGESEKAVVQQIWLGLLQDISAEDTSDHSKQLRRILNDVRAIARSDDSKKRSIQGFFLTTTLLMSGVSYLGGRLLRAASDGDIPGCRPFNLTEVRIRLMGNGSRVYNMLHHPDDSFGRIMLKTFEAGLDADVADFDGLYRDHENRVAPKVAVARGLLTESIEDGDAKVPVANLAMEEGYPSPDENGSTRSNTPLVDLYRAIDTRDVRLDLPDRLPPNMSRFVNVLGDALPYGWNGELDVIPALSDEDWQRQLKDADLYRRHMRPILTDRIYEKAEDSRGLEGPGQNPALEPLFVTNLAALIGAIRRTYAD